MGKLCMWWGGTGSKQEISVTSSQFYYESKTAVKKIVLKTSGGICIKADYLVSYNIPMLVLIKES